MKNYFHKITAKYLVLLLLSAMLLTGCGNQAATKKAEENTVLEESVYVLDADTDAVEYVCEKAAEADEIVYVQLDINPSFILGVTKDGTVVSIAANNEDAEDVLLNCLGDYFAEAADGVELENVICDLAEATKQGGYIEDTFNVSVTVISGEIDESTFEEAFSLAADNLAENDGIEAVLIDFSVENDTENSDSNPDGSIEDISVEEDKTCDLCHGECTIVCDLCNGTGTITETEEREVEVRNGYVCPYCGGAGILDDGLHGGETAVCGYCGADGQTGPMSGEFRELAYDTQIVVEEVENPCPRCNGSGILDCPHCNGTGFIE